MKCPYCKFDVPNDATKCGHCASDLSHMTPSDKFTFSEKFWLFVVYVVGAMFIKDTYGGLWMIAWLVGLWILWAIANHKEEE